ncbi:MAG: right-handed parallel beta-helix repeat-containing protein, partial [Candidatus Cloacimonetes bacterium]|nr:right-handed parallel beta-helix repeat-containing protein [Candidatus Cloacimonadota bacterium]
MKKIITMGIFFVIINMLASETVIPSGSVDGIWNLSGSPYIIEGDIYLNAGDQLTIEAGVQVLWTEFDKFEVSGQLNIQGSLSEPVILTTYDADDFWKGIEFYQADQNSIIENALISNAGNGLYLDQSDITIINTVIFYEYDASRLNTSDTGLTITQGNNSYLENCDITGYAKGIVIVNDDLNTSSTPIIVNTRVRNSAESDRAKSTGIKLEGVTAPTFDNCLIEGYQTGLDIANRTSSESTPVIINTRVRNSPETERNGKSTGILSDGYVSFDLIDCELEHFDTGLNLKNNSLVYNSTPTLHGTRVRYSPESDRKNTVGLNIQGNISPSITSCNIIDYDKGITQKNNDLPVVVITILTDTQIILAGEVDRAVTKGIEF